jgi:predicted ATPase/DNA-binding SARP family transcriptional activator
MGRETWLRVEVLGPIRVSDGEGRDVTPDGSLQRRLLALLILQRGRVVSADAAIEALWPERRPGDPVGALQTHISRLRRGLPAGFVESTAAGYYIAPDRLDVDADRLVDAVHRAVDAEDGEAQATIDAILERWQGPAYPELADVDAGRAEAMSLAELRIRAAETRAERRLAAGMTDGLVAELAALADDEPLRERPRELLMSALAASGRHAEALRVYDDFRRRLAEELGIAPSPALSAQHAELLGGVDGTTWKPARRLPLAVTSLEGRTTTIEEIIALAEARRLLTLIGPGGVGKTRLLVETGLRLQARRPDRPVVMCELAAASEDSAVDVVAAALTIDRRAGEMLADRLTAVLADTEVVLLLDNCEHVLDPIADVVDRLLVACPNVSLIATSRERLRVSGEQLYVVPALPTSADGPAVHLFVDRARAVNPQFDPDPAERASIAEIVRRLDGLPLAIELAAARLRTLDVDEVATGLDRRFELLSAGARTSTRHGSLAAAVSWSYELLDSELRRSFADLSVFAGPFTVEDAAAVCGIDVRRAATVLDQLAERSLMVRVGRRFALLETLRAFGVERLLVNGRAEEAGGRHARHYVGWIEDPERRRLESEHVLAEIDAVLPELRVALGWLLDRDEVELGGRLVVALANYGLLRLRLEVLSWAERVVAADTEDRSPLASQVWAVASYASWVGGDVTEAGVRSGRAVSIGEGAGEVSAIVDVVRGNHALFEGQLADAVAWYRRAVAAASDDPVELLIARATELLALAYAGDDAASRQASALLADVGDARTPPAAYAWYCAGEAELGTDVEQARLRLVRAVELAELTGASFVAGIAGASKASIEARLGDPFVAAEDYRRLIAHWRRAGMWSTQWTMLRSIAILLTRLGRPHDAALLTGSVSATAAGHRIFGADEAALAELRGTLREALGDDTYEMALSEGARLDGEAAIELALRALP